MPAEATLTVIVQDGGGLAGTPPTPRPPTVSTPPPTPQISAPPQPIASAPLPTNPAASFQTALSEFGKNLATEAAELLGQAKLPATEAVNAKLGEWFQEQLRKGIQPGATQILEAAKLFHQAATQSAGTKPTLATPPSGPTVAPTPPTPQATGPTAQPPRATPTPHTPNQPKTPTPATNKASPFDFASQLFAQAGFGQLAGLTDKIGQGLSLFRTPPVTPVVKPAPPVAAPVAPTTGTGAAGASGAAAGAAAGGASLAAVAGPIGAAIAATLYVADKAKTMMLDGTKTIGATFTAMAKLDPEALVDNWANAIEKAGPMGEIAAEAARQLKMFVKALDDTAKRLSPFHGELAAATAMADVRQILGDMRRAQLLGPELSRFTDARSRLSQSGQDALAMMLKPIIPQVTKSLELLNGLIKLVEPFIALQSAVSQQYLDGLEKALDWIAPAWANLLREIRKLGRENEQAGKDAIDALLNAAFPAVAGMQGAVQQPGFRMPFYHPRTGALVHP